MSFISDCHPLARQAVNLERHKLNVEFWDSLSSSSKAARCVGKLVVGRAREVSRSYADTAVAQVELDAIFESGPGPTLNLEDFKKLLLSRKAE